MASPPQKIGGITGGKVVRLHSGNGSRLNLQATEHEMSPEKR